jgi:hypothetical protein
MATETKTGPNWKRALKWLFRIYAGLCTLIFTGYLTLVLWSIAFSKRSSPDVGETDVMASYGEYAAKESPKRADYFASLAMTLGQYSIQVSPVHVAGMLKYLGKPDFISGTEKDGSLAYFYDHPGAKNKWAVYAFLQCGKLMQIGTNEVTANDHSEYRAYPAP